VIARIAGLSHEIRTIDDIEAAIDRPDAIDQGGFQRRGDQNSHRWRRHQLAARPPAADGS
jgi:hypothetical protein